MLNYNLREASNKYKEKEEQRRYLEEVIIQNEYCYDLIIDNSCNCIFITRNEKIIYANATAVNTFGTSKSSSIIGKNTREIICTDANIDKILEKFKENINSSKFIEILELKDFDGSKLKFEYSVNNIIYRGSPAYLIVLKNISQKEEIKLLKNDLIESEEKLDRLNELNKITTEFFCNISHELKTPINIILGAIQIIFQNGKEAASSFSEKQIQLLNIMKQNTYRLIRLVNNLIDISKCEVDYLILDKHNYNIVSIVEDITLSVCEFYKMKGINIIFDTDTEEKIMAADADKIERIILNLLSNSIKFTDKGGQVSVSFTDMGEFVRISVKDTGIGIPDDKIKLIFDRFEQVDKTLTRKREGSGIGLALVKKLVELHGGSINVVSKLSEGSEFIIELPVTVIDDEKIETSDFENKVDKINIEFSDIYSDD